jgi:hypothetical protein
MQIMKLERELSKFVREWIDARWQKWSLNHEAIRRDRRTGIYSLNQGGKLLDYLDSIMGNIEAHLGMDKGQHLIPSKFSSINQFAQFLQNFTQYLRDNYNLVEINLNKEYTDIIVVDIATMVKEIIEMSNRCLDIILDDENVPIPYQQVKKSLYKGDIKELVCLLNSIIKSIPYLIYKEKFNEGYFHSFFHVALTLIGMRPLSEVATSDGRIDMVIDCPKAIYIMEFKYSPNDKDLSNDALDQIKDKKYHQPFILQQKTIVGIGYSFGEKSRQITDYRDETLYVPQIILDKLK